MQAAQALRVASKTRDALVAFSRREIDATKLAVQLHAAGWSPAKVAELVASARKNLRLEGDA